MAASERLSELMKEVRQPAPQARGAREGEGCDDGHREIQKLLPHRYPFLLVDRVIEVVPGQKLVAYKNVTVNEPFFNGHFPGHPVMPGVLILEALAQACAMLAYKSADIDPEKKVTYLMAIDGAKFRKPVVPGRPAAARGRGGAPQGRRLEADGAWPPWTA